jgi:hypothetical protein
VSSVPVDVLLSPDFVAFALFFAVFFFILAGLSDFVASCAGGVAVWAEAIETLPKRAAQHTAIIRFRIFFSCWDHPRDKMTLAEFSSRGTVEN